MFTKHLTALAVLATATLSHAAEVALRLSIQDGIYEQYLDRPNAADVTKARLNYISFENETPGPLVRPDGSRVFNTSNGILTFSKPEKPLGKGFTFSGQEVVNAVKAYEDKGIMVKHILIFHEEWVYRSATGGPYAEDIRILSPLELQTIRGALSNATTLKSKNIKLIQLLGATQLNHTTNILQNDSDSWYRIIQNPSLLKHLESFDGVATECHIGDEIGDPMGYGPRQLKSMAYIARWAQSKGKKALVFMGGSGETYADNSAMSATYNALWAHMSTLNISKFSNSLIYFRQGARGGKHLPESLAGARYNSTLTGQTKWLVEQVNPPLP